MKIKT